MPRPRKPVTRCSGQICPERLYTTEGCLRHAGIGREQLIECRKSKLVNPIMAGRRLYYRGSELIAWIESQDTKDRSA